MGWNDHREFDWHARPVNYVVYFASIIDQHGKRRRFECEMTDYASYSAERNESVLMVPGSIAQMQEDMRRQDQYDFELDCMAEYSGF